MPFLLLRIPARVSTDRETPRCLREPPADHPVDQRPRSVQLTPLRMLDDLTPDERKITMSAHPEP